MIFVLSRARMHLYLWQVNSDHFLASRSLRVMDLQRIALDNCRHFFPLARIFSLVGQGYVGRANPLFSNTTNCGKESI